MTRVFVSYSHRQGEWVWDRLVPVLKAGGAEVLIDRDRFEAGKSVLGQMDEVQDEAERHVLVLSQEYLASKYCAHETKRAIARDPDFRRGMVIPVLRADCKLRNRVKWPEAVYVDLRDDRQEEAWGKLLPRCGANLGAGAAHWLDVRDEVRQLLTQDHSVNLVVRGKCLAWRGLIQHLADWHVPGLVQVDLNSGHTTHRPGLLREMLGGQKSHPVLPDPPEDLSHFQAAVESRPAFTRIALLDFDMVTQRS